MFTVLLKFSDNKASAGQFMDGHKAWLRQGFEEGVFLLAGSLQPGAGGAILAHNTRLDELQARLAADPFVAENVVTPEILEVTPNQADDRLEFLLG